MGEVLKSSTFSSGPNDKMKWLVFKTLFLFFFSIALKINETRMDVFTLNDALCHLS